MKTLFFVFPCMNISLEAPPEIMDQFSLIYPYYEQKSMPGSLHHVYRAKKRGEKWNIQKDGQTINEVQSAPLTVLSLEYDIEHSLLRLRKNWLAVHAGCVAIGNQACLVAGDPESGKTTTTFHLSEIGHRFMCEEIAFIDVETKSVIPFLQTLPLERHLIQEVKSHFPEEKGDLKPFNPYVFRYFPHNFGKDPCTLKTILLPKWDQTIPSDLISLNSSEVLTEFLGYCFEPLRNREEFFNSVIEVLENSQVYRLSYRNVKECRHLLLNAFPEAESYV